MTDKLPFRVLVVAAIGLLLVAEPALAACQLDLSSSEAMVRSSGCFGFYAEGSQVKKIGMPSRVAIASFQVRFDLGGVAAREVDVLDFGTEEIRLDGEGTHFFELAQEDYDTMASEFYDVFVEKLASRGIQVVPVETVAATAAYQRLKPDQAIIYKRGRFARATAHGLKSLKPRPSREEQDRYAAITQELKADAVLTVFATIGLFQGEDAASRHLRLFVGSAGEGNTTGTPLEIAVLRGAQEEKVPGGGMRYVPAWRSRFGVQKDSGQRLFYHEALRPPAQSRASFGQAPYADDVALYLSGATSLFGVVTDVALAHWAH